MKNISELNKLIYAGVKLITDKIDVPLKNTKSNSKPGWEIRPETQIKKSSTTSKNGKKEEERWNMLGRKGKTTQVKQTIQLEKINPKVLSNEEGVKRYLRWIKQYR